MLRAIPLVALGIVGTACGILDSDPAVRVFAFVSRPAVVPGDTTTISVVVTNVGHNTVTISGGGCLFGFEVIDGSGRVVAPGVRGCPDYLVIHRLLPGAALSQSFTWAGDRFDSEPTGDLRGSVTVRRTQLEPGEYGAVGVLSAQEMLVRSAPARVTLLSPR
jgi:hypothetical protein